MNDRAIFGGGTAESVWLDWLQRQSIPPIAVQDLCPDPHRLVVVAPHPDDEILACGGLLAMRAARGLPLLVVAVTDGEASHGMTDPGSRLLLGAQRVKERCAGLAQLGIDPACIVRLRIPDGAVAFHVLYIYNQLNQLLRPTDIVVTTWRMDGHPDHEATAQAVLGTGCKLYQAPVWMWHWAEPGDKRIPWSDLVTINLPDSAIRAKQTALAKHTSQLVQRNSQAGAVLLPTIVQRAARAQEYFFTHNG